MATMMNHVIAPTPEAMRMLTSRALDAYKRMLYPRARECAQTILRFEPQHVGMFVMMAELEAKNQQWQLALSWWLKVLNAGRCDDVSLVRAAEVASLASDWAQAHSILQWLAYQGGATSPLYRERAQRLLLYVNDQLKNQQIAMTSPK